MIKINSSSGESVRVEAGDLFRFLRGDQKENPFINFTLIDYSFSEIGLLTTRITTNENTVVFDHGCGVQVSCFGPADEIFRLIFVILITKERNLNP